MTACIPACHADGGHLSTESFLLIKASYLYIPSYKDRLYIPSYKDIKSFLLGIRVLINLWVYFAILTSCLYIILYLLNKDVFYDIAVVQPFFYKNQ